MSTPQVSVIIPVFNSAKTVTRALDSVVGQTFADLEVIVVDDGSTDQGAQLAEQAGIEGLTVIRHPENRGAAAARNTGIKAARGNWIAFLDSDDSWKPEKLARQIAALAMPANAGCRACATGYILHKHGQALTVRLNLSPDRFRHDILFGCTISPGTTLLVDQRVFEDVGLFDEKLRRLEDWDWLLRFSRCYDILILPEPLANISVGSDEPNFHFDKRDPVIQSIARIGDKQLSAFEGQARRQLQSSLYVETAARLYRAGKPIWAAAYVLAGLSVYPRRNAAFFRTLWRAVNRPRR